MKSCRSKDAGCALILASFIIMVFVEGAHSVADLQDHLRMYSDSER